MELKDYFRIFRRSIWLIILIILVTAGGGYYWSIRQTPIYQSSSTLLITVPEVNQNSSLYSDILSMERQAKTFAEMIMGSRVLEGASVTSSVPLLVDDLNAMPVADTQFIKLTYTGTDPVQVQAGLKTIADYFSKYVSQLYYGQGANAVSALEEQLKRSQTDLENAQQALNGLTTRSPSDLEVAQAKVTFYQGLYVEYQKQLDEIRRLQTSNVTHVLVYEPATLPVLPISPRTALNTTVAAVLGLFLGIGFAFLREYLDDTLKSEEDVGKFMNGLPVLGAVPVIPRNAMLKADDVNALPSPLRPSGKGVPFVALVGNTKSAASEGFRTLRTNLQFLSADKPLKVLVVTSSAPSEGKTTTALNLAISLAQMGQRVLLVDADLRRPSLHKSFNLAATPGLSNFLVGKAELSDVLKKTPIDQLQVLVAGPIPPMPAELLGSHKMGELLDQLRQQFDTVLLDTPPVIAVTDATLLATMADGVLLVISCGKTTREQAKVGLLTLEKAGITPLGVVMNQVDRRKGYGYYYYYYRRYYPSVEGNADTAVAGMINETGSTEGEILPKPASIREEPVQAATPVAIDVDRRKASLGEVSEHCDNLVQESQQMQAICFPRPSLDQPGLSAEEKQNDQQKLASLLSAPRSDRLVGDLTTNLSNEELKMMGLKEKLEELASKQFRRVVRGLDPSEVELAMRQATDLALELIQRNETMEKELIQFREQEGLMKRTFLHAEKIASTIQEEATKEALTVRAKAEIEAAEVVDQACKKADQHEKVLINRRTLVEKRMALYEHESNLLLYRLYDLTKHHVDELGQEVSSEVKSLLQRMRTEWEMLPQSPSTVSEGPSNTAFAEAKSAAIETPLAQIVVTESGTPTPPTSPTGGKFMNFANPMEELAAITIEEESPIQKAKEQVINSSPVATATPAVRSPLPAIEKRPVDGAQSADLLGHQEIDSVMQTKGVEEAVPERKSLSENSPSSSTGARGEEQQWVEESLLCGHRLVREIRDTQNRLVIGSGALVTRQLIHFLIDKGLYGELVASVSAEKEPTR